MNTTSILRNSGASIRHSWYVDGVLTDPDSSACTVVVTRADGTVLQTSTAAARVSMGVYAYTLAPQANLGLLTFAWTGNFSTISQTQTDEVEIVGGFYCSLAELLAMDGLAGTSVDVLAARRREFEDVAERYTGVAWVPRFARETYKGNGSTSLLLNHVRPRVILSASATDTSGTVTAFTTTNWQLLDHGLLVTDGDTLTSSVYGERNLTIEYEHGHDAPSSDLVQACKDFVAAKVLQSSNRRARDMLSSTDPSGFTERWSTPDWNAGRPTGLLDVDRALESLGRAAPLVG